jgi:MFS family permease
MISIATMIPYAVIPPLAEALLPYVRTDADIYAGVSLFAVVAIILLIAMRRRIGDRLRVMDGALLRRPSFSEIRENFRLHSVVLLLCAGLSIYLAHATFFYFMKDLSLQTGGGDVGLFFIICMIAMIAVRALGSVLFDRMDKPSTLKAGLILLILCIIIFLHADSPAAFYLLSGVYGFCMGIILPLLIALLFSASPPSLRSLNTNLNLFTLDMAYFLMPYLGGALIAFGAGFAVLFYTAAGFVLLSLALIVRLSHLREKGTDT